MIIKLRGCPTTQEIAEIHDALGDAYIALHNAFMVNGTQRPAMSCSSADALLRMQHKVRDAMLSLERPFFDANDGDVESPLTTFGKANEWTKWLQSRTEKTIRSKR